MYTIQNAISNYMNSAGNITGIILVVIVLAFAAFIFLQSMKNKQDVETFYR